MKDHATTPRSPWWFVAVMMTVLVWANAGLLTYWFSDPLGKYAFPSFMVWLVGFRGIAFGKSFPKSMTRWWTLVTVLLITGMLLNIQLLNQAALIGSLAGRHETKTARLCCYVAALGWTPFFGWAWHQIAAWDFPVVRIAWVIVFLLITYLRGIRDKR
jgi:hypothetical protein